MNRTSFILALALIPRLPAESPPPIYGVYALPDYEVAGAANDRIFKGWDFNSVTLVDRVESGLESVSMGQGLVRLPAVDASRRGASNLQPSIRGLGGERVTTFFNGLPLPGGSPTHVAPIGFFFPGSVATVSVLRAFPSVTGGPVTSSGRIELESPGLADGRDAGELAASARSGWEGFNAVASGSGRAGDLPVYGALSGACFGDYRTGGDDWVDADLDMAGAAGSMVWTGSERASANLAFVINHQWLARNASLPLDMMDTTMAAVTLDTTWAAGTALWRFRLGYSDTQPFLTSEDRPVAPGAPVKLVTANADARSFGGGFSVTIPWGASANAEVGIDFSSQHRNAVRYRHLTSGVVFQDHIWPEIGTSDLGLFGEFSWDQPGGLSLTAGLRLDRIWSDAAAADDPVVALPGSRGATIRENYGSFNGVKAMKTDLEDWAGAGQVLLEMPMGSPDRIAFLGVGVVRAVPGATERYRAFLNALGGGMEVGNPALAGETRSELDLGIRLRGEGWRLDAGGFAARIDDFVQREIIAMDPIVYGFRNRDVQLFGLEAVGEWTPTWLDRWGLGLDASIGLVRGEDRTTSVGLPEIPPWDIRAGLVWERSEGSRQAGLRLETRIVGAQDNPNPLVMPLYRDTAAFELWSLAGQLELGGGWWMEMAIENLFDRRYYEYLQAPVATGVFAPSSGTLTQGDSIPGFGRQVILSVRKGF